MHHGKKHSLMMVLCIGAPIAAMLLLSFGGGIAGKWSYALFLLCPLMHVAMMWGMYKAGRRDHDESRVPETVNAETASFTAPVQKSCH